MVNEELGQIAGDVRMGVGRRHAGDAIGGGYVDVSFYPVSSLGGVSFDDSKMPRFVESNDPVRGGYDR